MPLFVAALVLALQDFPTKDIPLDSWTLKVSTEVLKSEHATDWQRALSLMDSQLKQIIRQVGDEPLKKLQRVPIWINWDDKGTVCMAFHPGADYLKEHGMNPAMAGGVEVGNIKNFLSWTHEQPWMVLHELAHSYHCLNLPQGFDNPDVKAAYDAAMKAKLYDKVLHWDGSTVKHYAETNAMEFFSESSESYFGTNDFYPFVNAELKTYDPTTYALMQKIWGPPAHRD